MNKIVWTYLVLFIYLPFISFSNNILPEESNLYEVNNNCISFVFIPSNYNGQTISCPGGNDGSLTVNAFGGQAPYNYLWENGSTSFQRNNLSSGTYSVTVTDANGCSLNSSIPLQAPNAINISKNIINSVSCINSSDGIILASAFGGAAPYTYQWGNGSQNPLAENLTCGIHNITVTDVNGCAIAVTFGLECPTVMDITVTPISDFGGFHLSCPESTDGSAIVSVQQGAPPYTYQWSSNETTSTVFNLNAGINVVTVTDANGCEVISFVDMTAPNPMELIPNIISNYDGAAVSCHNAADGSILLGVVNGIQPYSYSWENGETQAQAVALTAGVNAVTVTDATGCIITDNFELDVFEINITPQVVSNYNGADISCHGASDGAIQMNVTAGVSSPPNVTYSWSNGHNTPLLENIPAGTYTFAVTSPFGCTATITSSITQPTEVNATTDPTSDYNGYHISINGLTNGAATVTPNGGVGPYTVLWENGETDFLNESLAAGNQNVTIIDINGCQTQVSVALSEPTPLDGFADVLSDYNGQDITCFGNDDGRAIALASGAVPPYTYNWSNNTSGDSTENLSAGNYIVTITDANGATLITDVDITEPQPITLEMRSTSASNPPNGTTTAIPTGGTAPYLYSWNDPFFRMTEEIDLLSPDWYRVTVTDFNNCKAEGQIEVTQSFEIDCIKENIIITPNGDGRNDELTLECIHPFNNDIEIYDRWGNLIFQDINYQGIWEALQQSKAVPNGGYFYIMNVALPTGKKTYKGSLTIIR